jgi:hypothetical protein
MGICNGSSRKVDINDFELTDEEMEMIAGNFDKLTVEGQACFLANPTLIATM